MSGSTPVRSIFRLETLESRTLLAVEDPSAGLVASAPYLVSFEPNSSQITIAAPNGGDLTIDSALLPATLTALAISGFDHVTINGTEKLSSLTISRIGTFEGSGVNIFGTLQVTEVASVKVNSIAGAAMLSGTETRLEVTDSRGATIFSGLDKIVLNSTHDIFLISLNANQEVRVESGNGHIQDHPKVLQTTDLPTDGHVTTVNGDSFNVIILSLSPNNKDANQLLSRLQTALKQGDFSNANAAFSDLLKSIKLGESAYVVTFPVGTSAVDMNLAEIGRARNIGVQRLIIDSPADRAGNGTLLAPIGDQRVGELRLFESGERNHGLERAAAQSIDGMPSTEFGSVTLSVFGGSSVSDRSSTQTDASAVAAPELSISEQVRSTLSNLTAGLNHERETVSGYIMGRLSNEFQPGARPGLLVDAKPSRGGANRETFWVEV